MRPAPLPADVADDRPPALIDTVPHVQAVGDAPEPVGDEYADLNVPHAATAEEMESGGRIEPKWYNNRNGTRRLYYVRRFERKHSDGRRYRPMHYVGINPPGSIAVDVPHASGHVPHAVPHVSGDGPHARREPGAADEA